MTGPPPVALVTGFGPFLDVADNPSGLVAARLDGREVAGVTVRGRTLPVSYARAPAALARQLAALRPVCVVALGAGRGDAITLEGGARNRANTPHPDCDGVTLVHTTLDPVALPRLGCDLPLAAWARSLARPGAPVVTSEDAGGYVCNATYFALLMAKGIYNDRIFIHMPRRTDSAALAAAERVVLSTIARLVAATRGG
ncbi:MAG: hypothetical protein CVU56_20700 [Deltaproteobacteria bacterium HGW-Deltaproteobacteria-14]|jgi:pyroglutamyl-peptidase|nr:MAG: hypothetical protein CVU56_20700 [Deltaproteobacteria bacterium HGW-Deltaproteobacteria-14]